MFVKSRQNVGSFLSYMINMSFNTLSHIGIILIFVSRSTKLIILKDIHKGIMEKSEGESTPQDGGQGH